MNRKPGYGAELRANLDPTKGVGRLRQQDGGHGSRNPLRTGGRVQRLEEHRTSRGVRCAPAALENPEDRVPPTPVVLITASGLQGEQPLVDGTIHEPVGCRWTVRAAPAARAGPRVPDEGQTGNGPFGVPSQALNSRLRTESGLEAMRAPAVRLPTSSRGLGPQRRVSLVNPVRRMSRKGRLEEIPIERRVESFADDLNTRRGIVSGRVALLPRSTEIQPSSLRFVPPLCLSKKNTVLQKYAFVCLLGLQITRNANNCSKSQASKRSLVHVFSRALAKRAQRKVQTGTLL
ncbi:hypothetical protein G2W53_040070 [Senna tora]|uniref:Uncharacterized protein n=1 Tax=Senna tora TaxID=362788 RepID=A0A834SPU2_9FABA|nr:hypothetical protein G2W53_040070 [Senna tora]